MAEKKYQVELSVCVGVAPLLPIQGFPELPSYRSVKIGEPLPKRDATKRLNQLCKLNHGYIFGMSEAK